ncbi:MAG: hypothetical protein ACLU5E_10445 [Anaerovoracaceae bacterium]
MLKDKRLEATWQVQRRAASEKIILVDAHGKRILKSMSEEWGNLLEAVSELKGEEE